MRYLRSAIFCVVLGAAIAACGPSTGGSCETDADCPEEQLCLNEFKGGYCGIKGCDADADCPDDTLCVIHEGTNYCFLRCVEKPECNAHRPVEAESNCSSNFEPVEEQDTKACIPPAGD